MYAGQWETGQADIGQSEVGQAARLETVARRQKKTSKKKQKPAPVVSRAQMELAQEMVVNAYRLGRGLGPKQRVALMTR
jgi:hypothetical protein